MSQNSLEKLVYEQTSQLKLLEASIRADTERLIAERQVEKERFREWREQFDADLIKEAQHARERRQADLEKRESDRKADLERLESGRKADLEKLEIERKTDLERLESERKAGLEKLDIELRHQKTLHDARMAEAEKVNKETLRKVDRLFTTIILTGISSSLTVLLGVGAINAAIANNMLTSYNGGKDHATWEAQIQQELREHQATLLQIQKRLDQQPPPRQ